MKSTTIILISGIIASAGLSLTVTGEPRLGIFLIGTGSIAFVVGILRYLDCGDNPKTITSKRKTEI
jgi:hypothetical protein